MENYLKDWLYLVDTKVCKIRSNRIKTREQAMRKRINGVFVAEKLDTNAHFHGAIKLPDYQMQSTSMQRLQAMKLTALWEDYCPSGTLKINFTTDTIGASIYFTKEFKRPNFSDQVLFADKFWPSEYGL